jgi:hypothetical protein
LSSDAKKSDKSFFMATACPLFPLHNTTCQSGEGLAGGFPPVLHPQPLAQTPHASFEPRGFPSDLTTSHQDIAHTHLGFSGSVPYPRPAFTPSKMLSDWLPSPCDRSYRLQGGALLPRLLRSLCPVVPGHLKRGQPPPNGGEAEHRSSHVHALCLKQTNLGGCQAPLVQQHPRVQGSLLLPKGLNLADSQHSPGDSPPSTEP